MGPSIDPSQGMTGRLYCMEYNSFNIIPLTSRMNREAVFGRKKRLVVCFCFFPEKNSFKKTQFPLLQGQFDQSLQEMGGRVEKVVLVF